MSLSEFSSGAIFGLALFSSGVWAPEVIKSQMTFSSNTMITVMMGASATSAIVFDIAQRLQIFPKKHPPPSNFGLFSYDGNIIGGSLIGVAMTLTGACPGTSLIQAGMGSASGLLVVAGGIVGAMAFRKLRPVLEKAASRLKAASSDRIAATNGSECGKALDIASALNIHPLVLLLVWIPMCIAVMQVVVANDRTVRDVPTTGLVTPRYGGILIGVAQLATVLSTKHALGASVAFENVAQWIQSKLSRTHASSGNRESLLTPSTIFSVGVICSAPILSHLIGNNRSHLIQSLITIQTVDAAKAVVGGMMMVFGSSMAKGCTSGHGISGLARFSLASLATTVAMFSSGVATAQLLGY